MRKILVGILVASTLGSGTFLFMPAESQAASCPAGTTAVRRIGPLTGIRTLVDDCVRDGVVVGTADVFGYTPRAPTGDVTINDCATWNGGWTSGTCWGISLIILIGTGVTSVLSAIPWYADKLLNLVVENTVLFSGFNALYSYASPGIEKGWELIRDLVNIAIIGVFVFIAISIILGLKEYGQKKLIAKVLIVAILINFSFLFTRLIINFSNGLATSIYSRTLIGPNGKATGIGVRFLDNLKVGTIDTVSSNVNQQTRNGLVNTYNAHGMSALLMHILVTAFVCIISGIALFYIAYLLMIRFITLVALLAVSSAAFGAYLLPTTHSLWTQWWRLLWENAFVAPVLFIFLWMALNISDPISKFLDKGAKFGDISPTAVNNSPAIYLLMNYVLVMGFLLAGIFVANSLSTMLGRRFATNMTAAPFTLGARITGGIASPLFNRFALARKTGLTQSSEAAGAKAAQHSKDAALVGDRKTREALLADAERQKRKSEKYARRAQIWGGRTNSNLNMADASAIQKGLKAAGVSGFFSGASSKGKSLEDKIKVRAEAATKAAPKMSSEDQAKIRSDEERKVSEQRKASQQQLDAAREQKRANEQMLKQLHEQTVRNQDAIRSRDKAAADLAVERNGGGTGVAEKERIAKAKEAAALESQKKLAEMVQGNDALKRFTGLENGVTAELTEALQAATRETDAAHATAETHREETPKVVREVGDKVVKAIQESYSDIAQGVARGNVVQRASDFITGDKAYVDKAIAKKLKDDRSANAQIANILKQSGVAAAATADAKPEEKPH